MAISDTYIPVKRGHKGTKTDDQFCYFFSYTAKIQQKYTRIRVIDQYNTHYLPKKKRFKIFLSDIFHYVTLSGLGHFIKEMNDGSSIRKLI